MTVSRSSFPDHCRVALVDGECPAGQEQNFATCPEALRQFVIDTGYIGAG